MPSVPKYLRLIRSPSSQRDEDLHRVDGFAHVVHAHEGRPILHCEEGRGNAAGHALFDAAAGDVADGALARKPDEHRIAQPGKAWKRAKKLEVVLACLAESEAGIEDDAVAIDARTLERCRAIAEELRHLRDDIVVSRRVLHRA